MSTKYPVYFTNVSFTLQCLVIAGLKNTTLLYGKCSKDAKRKLSLLATNRIKKYNLYSMEKI